MLSALAVAGSYHWNMVRFLPEHGSLGEAHDAAFVLSIEPQAQLIGQHLSFSHRGDVEGFGVDIGHPSQGTARVGFRLTRPFQDTDGTHFTPYLKVNLLQGLGGPGAVLLGGTSFATGRTGTALQAGAGVTGTLTPRLSVYGDVALQSDVGHTGGFRGWTFNAGFRFLFGGPVPHLAEARPG